MANISTEASGTVLADGEGLIDGCGDRQMPYVLFRLPMDSHGGGEIAITMRLGCRIAINNAVQPWLKIYQFEDPLGGTHSG